MTRTRSVLPALAALALAAVPATASGRVVDRPAARAALHHGAAHASKTKKIRKPTWLTGVAVTEYYPIPESFFVGKKVHAPGLSGKHRIDWLFSARGLTMEGDGVGLDGKRYHVESIGHGGWVDKLGRNSCIGCSRGVYWRAGAYWKNSAKHLTFPLDGGGWFSGVGKRYIPLPGVRFGSGPSLDLDYYASLAVDPSVIPLGSRVYIPYYKRQGLGTGWFKAQDTGGAIGGRHVDVYRPAPESIDDEGRSLSGQRIYVVPPR
jgi:3D (Asp-Asp-Asp) domain-containing protein